MPKTQPRAESRTFRALLLLLCIPYPEPLGAPWSFPEVYPAVRLGTKTSFVNSFIAKCWKYPRFEGKFLSNGLGGENPYLLFILMIRTHLMVTLFILMIRVMLGSSVTRGAHKSQPILSTASTNNEESREITLQASAEDTPSVSVLCCALVLLCQTKQLLLLLQRGAEGCRTSILGKKEREIVKQQSKGKCPELC